MAPGHQIFCQVAIEVLSFPASAAAVERTFSAVKRLHTWQRGKLNRDTVAALTYVYVNRRALDQFESL